MDIAFDRETGEPSIHVSGNITNPDDFRWGDLSITLGGTHEFQIAASDIVGSTFQLVLPADFITQTLDDVVANDDGLLNPIPISISSTGSRVVDVNGGTSAVTISDISLLVHVVTGEGPDDVVVGSDDIVLIGRDDEDYSTQSFSHLVEGQYGSTVAAGKATIALSALLAMTNYTVGRVATYSSGRAVPTRYLAVLATISFATCVFLMRWMSAMARR